MNPLKTYYHVSSNYDREINEFIPRIPHNRASGEDAVQKRICVSTSLQGCIKAAPTIWYHMHTYLNAEYYDPYTHMERLTTLLEQNEKVGYLFKVYEFYLDEGEVISASVLKENEWVPDADQTNEHWITKPIKPSKSYYILIENTKEENNQPIFDVTTYQLHELGGVENYYDTFNRQREAEMNAN